MKEINLEKLCTGGSQANYFTGVYYCPADANGFPDAGGLEPLTVWQPSLNDWGWNATKPAANINGALITPVNTLLIGKQGNIFVTSNDGVTPNENVVGIKFMTYKVRLLIAIPKTSTYTVGI